MEGFEMLKVVDCRHQKNGQVRLWGGSQVGHVANVLRSAGDGNGDPLKWAHLFATAPHLLRLAEAVVKYFGTDAIPECLDGDRALKAAAEAAISLANGDFKYFNWKQLDEVRL